MKDRLQDRLLNISPFSGPTGGQSPLCQTQNMSPWSRIRAQTPERLFHHPAISMSFKAQRPKHLSAYTPLFSSHFS